MFLLILIFDMALVAWSLHLMQSSVQYQEFSLMFAGTLVAMSAAAILVACVMMRTCLGSLG